MKKILSTILCLLLTLSLALGGFAQELDQALQSVETSQDIIVEETLSQEADIAPADKAEEAAEVVADVVADQAADVVADEASDVIADEASDVIAEEASDVVADEAADVAAEEASDGESGAESIPPAAVLSLSVKPGEAFIGDKITVKAEIEGAERVLFLLDGAIYPAADLSGLSEDEAAKARLSASLPVQNGVCTLTIDTAALSAGSHTVAVCLLKEGVFAAPEKSKSFVLTAPETENAEEGKSEEADAPAEDVKSEDADVPAEEIKSEEADAPAEDVKSEEAVTAEEEIKSEETVVIEEETKSEEAETPVEETKSEETEVPAEETKSEETVIVEEEAKSEETEAPVEETKSEETEVPAEEAKSEETQSEEAKSEEAQSEETVIIEEVKSEEAEITEEVKSEETEAPAEEIKSEEETKSEETQSEETKSEEAKSEETEAPAEEPQSEETEITEEIPAEDPEPIVAVNSLPTKIIPDETTIRLDVLEVGYIVYTFYPDDSYDDVTFTSSASSIARVDKETGEVTALKKGTAYITLKTSNGKSAKVKIIVSDPYPPTSISLDCGKTYRLSLDDTLDIAASILPTTAVTNIVWTSSAAKVATVDQSGHVQPLKAGTVTIKATCSNGKYASVKITVFDPTIPTSVSIDESTPLYVELYDTHDFTATVLPDTAVPYTTLSWSSSNKKVATVDENGTLTGLKCGSITLTVKTQNGKKSTCKVIVYDPLVPQYVTLNETGTVDLPLDGTLQLSAAVFPDTAPQDITWSSSNKKIAAVDEYGLVTPLKTGTITITAKSTNGKKATVKVRVYDPRLPISVSCNYSGTVAVDFWDEGLQVIPEVYPATAEPYTGYVFTSSKTSVARIDSEGNLTLIGAGKTTITVKTSNPLTKSSVKCTFTLQVTDPNAPTAIYFDQGATYEMDLYDADTLSWHLAADWQKAKVTWTTSSSSILYVDQEGNLTPRKSGYANITITTQNGKKAACRVHITDTHAPTGIYFDESVLNTYLDVGYVTITPRLLGNNEPYAKITWTSSSAAIAAPESSMTVADDVSDGSCLINLYKQGTVTLTATTHNGKKATLRLTITVPTMPATVTLINESTGKPCGTSLAWDVNRDGALLFTVECTAVGGEGYDADPGTITYTSSNSAVASIDQTGTVTWKKNGSVRFTAKTGRGNLTASCTVQFYTYVEVQSITITTSASTLYVGSSLSVGASCLPAASKTGAKLCFTSSDPDVIEIDESTGLMTAVGAGYATITCTDEKTGVVSNELYIRGSYPPVYRALIIGSPSEKSVRNTNNGQYYSVTWNRTADINALRTMLSLQSYGGRKISVKSLPAATKETALNAIDSIASLSTESDITFICICAEGTDNGTIWLGDDALTPAVLAEALDTIEGRVVVFMANDYAGYYITEGSDGEKISVAANGDQGKNFAASFTAAFQSRQSKINVYPLDESGNPILPAAVSGADGSLTEGNWGELLDDKFYVLCACTAFEEAYFVASVKSWNSTDYTAVLNESGCYDYFVRGLCNAGGYNPATGKTSWSGRSVTLATAYSQTASFVRQHESASAQTGYTYTTVSVYPSSSSFIVFQH